MRDFSKARLGVKDGKFVSDPDGQLAPYKIIDFLLLTEGEIDTLKYALRSANQKQMSRDRRKHVQNLISIIERHS